MYNFILWFYHSLLRYLENSSFKTAFFLTETFHSFTGEVLHSTLFSLLSCMKRQRCEEQSSCVEESNPGTYYFVLFLPPLLDEQDHFAAEPCKILHDPFNFQDTIQASPGVKTWVAPLLDPESFWSTAVFFLKKDLATFSWKAKVLAVEFFLQSKKKALCANPGDGADVISWFAARTLSTTPWVLAVNFCLLQATVWVPVTHSIPGTGCRLISAALLSSNKERSNLGRGTDCLMGRWKKKLELKQDHSFHNCFCKNLGANFLLILLKKKINQNNPLPQKTSNNTSPKNPKKIPTKNPQDDIKAYNEEFGL